MSEVDVGAQYRLAEKLYGEQNFVNGAVAGLVASLAAAVVWGGISVATGYMIGYVAIGVGIAVGYGVQVFGKGLSVKYSLIAALFGFLGCMLGNLVAGILFEAKDYGAAIGDIVASLTVNDIIAFYAETLEIMDLLFWFFAVGAAWQFAPRKLTEEEALAVYAYENRAGQQSIAS